MSDRQMTTVDGHGTGPSALLRRLHQEQSDGNDDESQLPDITLPPDVLILLPPQDLIETEPVLDSETVSHSVGLDSYDLEVYNMREALRKERERWQGAEKQLDARLGEVRSSCINVGVQIQALKESIVELEARGLDSKLEKSKLDFLSKYYTLLKEEGNAIFAQINLIKTRINSLITARNILDENYRARQESKLAGMEP